jgi:trans-aconitate methyltransferase
VDLATGTGEPGITAARRVRPDGKILGIDISSNMLAIARESKGAWLGKCNGIQRRRHRIYGIGEELV